MTTTPDASARATTTEQPTVVTRLLEVPFTLTRAGDDDEGDGLTLTGYAAVFNRIAHIDDQDGTYDEVIRPGAFKRTLDHNPRPPMMFEHGRHPLIGKMPIGVIRELSEDPRGLFVRARLFDNWMIEPVRDAIREKAIPGMSFRFEIPRGGATMTTDRNGTRLRSIKEAKLYELGPVVFPAYADTTLALRSLERAVPSIHIVTTGSDKNMDTAISDLLRNAAEAIREAADALDQAPASDVVTDPPDVPDAGGDGEETPPVDDVEPETERSDGTPSEPADTGTSDEPAEEPERQMPQTFNERRAFLRRIELERRAIRQEKTA